MLSFSKFTRRAGHLVWRPGDLAHPVQEDLGAVRDYLRGLPHAEERHHEDYPEVRDIHPAELENQHAHLQRIAGSEPHQAALSNYKANSASAYNNTLRRQANHTAGGIIVPSTSASFTGQKHIERYAAMDQVVGHRTAKPISLYRGFSQDFNIHDLHVGHEFTDHGYTGTTPLKDTALDYGRHGSMALSQVHKAIGGHDDIDQDPEVGNHPLRRSKVIGLINIPAGTTGHYLDHPKNPNRWGESEFTLGRGTRFRVTGHGRVKQQYQNFAPRYEHVVHMDVIGQDPKPLIAG